jgi:orotidine-5'-phosphate decarboxylase
MHTQTHALVSEPRRAAADRLIVALDVPTLVDASSLVTVLSPSVQWFKVGSDLFTAAGPQAVELIRTRGGYVFLDLKFHDIPRSVGAAVAAAARLGVAMVDVHIAAGEAALRAAVEAAASRSRVLGVTRLTSLEDGPGGLADIVDAAALAKWCGLDGVVASAHEAAAIKAACGQKFLVVTPGIRPVGTSADDQRRHATPAEAICAGADYLVVGRPVLASADPAGVVSSLLREMDAPIR